MAADRSHFFWWGGEPELIRVARGENLMLPGVLPQPMGYMFDHFGCFRKRKIKHDSPVLRLQSNQSPAMI